GAGKSTFVGALAGLVRLDDGEIRLEGAPVRIDSPRASAARSIGVVHQHFALVPALTALENVALSAGRDVGWGPLPLSRIRQRARDVAARTGLDVPLDARVEDLSVGARQRLEILKLLYRDPRVLVLDEPTAVLSPPEVDGLFRALRALAAEGRTVILIAHKLDEVLSIASRVTVLRRGETVLEAERAAVDALRLGRAMVGFDPPRPRPHAPRDPGPVVARLRGVGVTRGGRDVLTDVGLEVRSGEILAVAGVEGNGQRELALVLAGMEAPTRGEAQLPPVVGYVPQERLGEGLIGSMDLVENVALALRGTRGARRRSGLDWPALRKRTEALLEEYDVRAPGPRAPARTLSGGNQQKLVVGREVARDAPLLVVENPTRGLDLGAAAYVQERLLRLRDEGRAVVLISTDLDEVLTLGDRIGTLVRGRWDPVPDAERTPAQVGARMLSASV
ncbi:MAG: ATP-binding cassette domain-containing protein, partial [Gemmatimonadetes bacterium]|nr:ATP-binding cassette domain-containing protein [Gemmatimonadota bacterium]